VELTDLRIFLAVATTQTITKAAQELHTVQSNVSVRIHALEKEIGVPLFRRHARGVTLTRAGEQLQSYARRIMELAEEAKSIAGDDREPAGSLCLGAMETTAGLRLPEVLRAFADRYPKVDLSLAASTTDELIQAVIDGKLDGAFVAGPVTRPGLVAVPSYMERLVLVAPPRIGNIDAELLRCPTPRALVFRAGCGYRARLERLLLNRGAATVRIMEFGTLEGILGCVAAGMGFTLLPADVVAAHHSCQHVRTHDLPDDVARVQTMFVHRDEPTASPALRCFLTHISAARTPELGDAALPSTFAAAAAPFALIPGGRAT
jgi:DNA-binding transcriptional LysR family regulator